MAEAILAQRLSLQAGLTQARNSALLAGMESQPKNTKKTYRFPQADFRVSKAPLMGDYVLIYSNRPGAPPKALKAAALSARTSLSGGCRSESCHAECVPGSQRGSTSVATAKA
jgi:hypothetical protein